MVIRRAGQGDIEAVQALWHAFHAESDVPPHVTVVVDDELREVEEIVRDGIAFVAEHDGVAAGFALARRRDPRTYELTDLFVADSARRDGVAAQLVHAVVEALPEEAETLRVEVASANAVARGVYQRWGLREHAQLLLAPVADLRERLRPGRHARSFASIHVQSDERSWVEQAAREFARRIGSHGTRVEGPRNGWTAVYDEAVDRDPNAALRFSRELSERLGAVVITLALELDHVVRMIALDRGGIVDEYLSVPEFYGPLPPGDVIGLAANPTVLHRLTGADPAAVKAVARTAASPSELPAAPELLAAIGGVLGLEGVLEGYAQ
ncbi:MAG: N-acetyltransferase family protein [Gaiella sp.]